MYKTLRAPLTAQIEITGLCNNNCLHCYNFWRKDGVRHIQQNMSPEQIKLVFRKFSDAKIFDTTITGGEPLLNKEGLITCLTEANRLGIGANINSNLTPLDEGYLKELKSLGVKSFLTSILGPNAETHDYITQRKGSFDVLIKNILLCLKNGVQIVPNMVVSSKNIGFLRKTAELIHSMGINSFVSIKAGCPGNCKDFSGLSISLEQFRFHLEELLKVEEDLKMKVDVLESYPLCGIKNIDRFRKFTGRKCFAGITSFTVASGGNVRPCSHIDISYGNIFHEDISSIWKNMEGWRDGQFMAGKCKKCKLFAMCGGGCRMEAKMINKSFTELDPYASVGDVDFCVQVLDNAGRQGVQKNMGDIIGFTLNPRVRWRKEFFGSVVMANKKSRTCLDHKGTSVLKQIKCGNVYKINDPRIEWGSLDSRKFVLGLVKRKIVDVISTK